MSNKNYKEILIQKYDLFYLQDDQAEIKLLRNEIENILKKIEKPDSHDFQIWALIYYLSLIHI